MLFARGAHADDEDANDPRTDTDSATRDDATGDPWRAPATEETVPAEPRGPEPPVVIVSPPPPPRPVPSSEPLPLPPPPPAKPVRGPLELSLGATMFPAALRDVWFTGQGTPVGTAKNMTFRHAGRELGLRNPTFFGAELGVGIRGTHFGVIVSGAFAGNTSGDATPTNAQAAGLVGTNRVLSYGGGIELFGAVPLGRVTVSLGAIAGLRGFSMPLVGFEPTTCTSRGRRGSRTYPCPKTASTTATPYVQPRLRLDVALDRDDTMFLGGYVGVDALGDRSMLGGLLFGVRLGGARP